MIIPIFFTKNMLVFFGVIAGIAQREIQNIFRKKKEICRIILVPNSTTFATPLPINIIKLKDS